ncbi:MAG: DeoR/GlpR family DNA-binding transcription regulator [Treponema sp.]|nr:DeoR/GlpR family DNA-binding transcription regulator [Treponema sp.]
MTERQNRILKILAENQRVEISALAKTLDVSQVTIRKDLNYLEKKNAVKRRYGYAQFGSNEDIGDWMAVNYDIKRRIAKAAAEMVEDGETIMIGSGSCCALLAEELANHKQITIITNSAFIAGHIRHAPYARVFLLGGEYQNSSQVLVGSITSKGAEIFISDKFFMGTDGFTEKYGFTGRDHLRTQTARNMAQQAKQVIILADSDKFLRQGSERLVRAEEVSAVFTDDKILPKMETILREKNVGVHKVPSSGILETETQGCKKAS